MSQTKVSRTTPRSRREEYSESTRSALVSSALELFSEGGYPATSLDAIAASARVTKGALYHHFPGGKKSIFEAAFDQIERDVHHRLTALIESESDPWDAARTALRVFLDICLEPVYRRLVWQEAPHVLGMAAWWDCEQRYGLGLIASLMEKLMDAGVIERLPVVPLARTVSGALAGAAATMNESDDPLRVRADFELVISRMLKGLAPTQPV
ncbi:MAG TPA: TetR/AcrR family transcriptional regulator [Pseudonocardia sp.]